MRLSNLKISTDLPFPSYYWHKSPYNATLRSRTPPFPVSLCSLYAHNIYCLFRGFLKLVKQILWCLIFGLTYHFITRCFDPLDIQLPSRRMRDKNCIYRTRSGLMGTVVFCQCNLPGHLNIQFNKGVFLLLFSFFNPSPEKLLLWSLLHYIFLTSNTALPNYSRHTHGRKYRFWW